jgi:hypothetical protein
MLKLLSLFWHRSYKEETMNRSEEVESEFTAQLKEAFLRQHDLRAAAERLREERLSRALYRLEGYPLEGEKYNEIPESSPPFEICFRPDSSGGRKNEVYSPSVESYARNRRSGQQVYNRSGRSYGCTPAGYPEI